MKPNQLLLTFADSETTDYVKLVCRRKGTSLESYIIDNFEWDDKLYCMSFPHLSITWRTCDGCEYSDRCPDVKKKESKWVKRGTASRIIPRSGR